MFVELEQGLEGLLHISELSDDKIESPEDVVKVGDEVDVKVLRVDQADRKIGLSMRNVDDPTVPDIIPDIPQELLDMEAAEREREKNKGRGDLRGGTGSAGPLFKLPEDKE